MVSENPGKRPKRDSFSGLKEGELIRKLLEFYTEAHSPFGKNLLSDKKESLRREYEAQKKIELLTELNTKMKELLERLTQGPWRAGTFLGTVETTQGKRAVVGVGQRISAVVLGENINEGDLQFGQEVFLNSEGNIVLFPSSLQHRFQAATEIAIVDQVLGNGTVIAMRNEEPILLRVGAQLADTSLNPGDWIRFDSQLGIAFEKIEKQNAKRYFFRQVPPVPFAMIGGYKEQRNYVLARILPSLENPEAARRYGQNSKRTILLHGPPGNGKTLMAKALAYAIGQKTGKKTSFAVVKPGEWESPFVGVTQRNIRECFDALKAAAKNGYAFLFLDEIESIGRIRGNFVGFHADRFLAALLTEIEGFQDMENVLIVAATNRKDLLDPALLQRLSHYEIYLGPPTLEDAREIFQIHLKPSYPYSRNGSSPEDTRKEMVERALSLLYSPNADNETCLIRFRDGTQRTVHARELISGRIIEQICLSAASKAFYRFSQGGEPGLSVRDIEEATYEAIESLRSTLTIQNARSYLRDLPQDLPLLSVEPIQSKQKRVHRYLRVLSFPKRGDR